MTDSTTKQGTGYFLVLEGIDGSGTTTQAARLGDQLRMEGHEVLLTHEPTTGPVGRFLRQALRGELSSSNGQATDLDWASMALLFAADRMDHLRREIVPALRRGAVVISDRYDLSSLIYQSITSPDNDKSLHWLRALNQYAHRPDLTIVLDISADAAKRRRDERGEKAEIYEKDKLQQQLQKAYSSPGSYLPKDSMVLLDGGETIGQVATKIRQALQNCPEFGRFAVGEG